MLDDFGTRLKPALDSGENCTGCTAEGLSICLVLQYADVECTPVDTVSRPRNLAYVKTRLTSWLLCIVGGSAESKHPSSSSSGQPEQALEKRR